MRKVGDQLQRLVVLINGLVELSGVKEVFSTV